MSRPLVVLDAYDVRREGKGVSRAVRSIVTRLCATNDSPLRFVVLTTREGSEILGLAPEHVRVVEDARGTWWEQRVLPTKARALGASLIYTQRECPPLWGPPVVAHIHEDPLPRWRRDLRPDAAERMRRLYTQTVMPAGLHRAEVVIASTEATRQGLSARMRLREVEVVRLGIDDVFFESTGAPRNHLFHLGSADRRDNTLIVAQAYARFAASHPAPPPLRIAGSLGSLESTVRSLATNADGSIELLGRVSDQQLKSLYQEALICLQPSSDEGFGLQPLEALASGAPLIAYDTPAVRETVADAATLLPTLNSEALGEAVARLLADQPQRDDLSRRGRERAEAFRWEHSVEMLHSVLLRVSNRQTQR